MKLEKPYKVKCKSCQTVSSFEIDIECVSSYERRMGPEMEYLAVVDDICPECGSNITIRVEAWEYPIGQVNDYDITIEGGEEMETPIFIAEDMV